VYLAAFPEEEFAISFDPPTDGPRLVTEIERDGLLIDTFRNEIGKGLFDYYTFDSFIALSTICAVLDRKAWPG
jgi:hypothetical protein